MPECERSIREVVKMETADFLRTHQWDDERSSWVLKPGVAIPAGVKPRAQVAAETRPFLATHTFDEVKGAYVAKAPRKTK